MMIMKQLPVPLLLCCLLSAFAHAEDADKAVAGREPQLELSEPVTVALAPPEVKAWGPYQFPGLERLSDGTIQLSYHVEADSAKAYGLPPARWPSSFCRRVLTRMYAATVIVKSSDLLAVVIPTVILRAAPHRVNRVESERHDSEDQEVLGNGEVEGRFGP